MILPRLIRRYLVRRPGRTLLTVLGVASALLLFVCVESLSQGLDDALSAGDSPRTLIVYRKNRYCPQTSFLPERYASQIAKIDGVTSVLPVKVFLSNCRASLDVVAFQGAPAKALLEARPVEIVAGDVARFEREKQAALVGREFARRRGLEPGESFRFADIVVDVAGVFTSPDPVEESLILTHLEFLQRATAVNKLGTVTQFEVKVADARQARRVAEAIDALFATAEEPTDSRARVAFLEDATRELREILRYGRGFGVVCVLVVLALVANTVLMSVHERRREFGVFLTLGYQGRHLGGLVVGEAAALALSGVALGLLGAFCLVHFSHLAIGVEGVTVRFALSARVLFVGAVVGLGSATLAALFPALLAARSRPQALLKSA